jgi:rhodanese-related sulfurtransferase
MTKKSIIIISSIVAVVILSAVIFSTTRSNIPYSDSATRSPNLESKTNPTNFQTIATVHDLYKRLNQNNPDDVLVDVRTAEEFNQGHIQKAINIDLNSPNFQSEVLKLDKSKTYIVFCRSGNRSLTASKIMANAGLKVINSSEGMAAWMEAELPIAK